MNFIKTRLPQIVIAICLTAVMSATTSAQTLVYHDATLTDGIGSGKHIVFLAGDHEYRSEETLPALAKILAKNYGFKCTVLFNVDEETGEIVPGNNNMPGTEALETADLMVVFLRFQNFPDEQMQPIADYLERGGPVVGLRTSTHAFKIPAKSTFARFDFKYKGEEFEKGFGRQILGETWVSHYGKNHVMCTRLDVVEEQKDHPILRGVEKPWAQCGGYWVEPMEDSTVLAMAQPLSEMTPDSAEAEGKKPCPGVWVREYTSQSGNTGRVFTTTHGASEDILDDDFRRMMLNGCLWAVGLEEQIAADATIDFVGRYTPLTFGFGTYRLQVKPSDYEGWESNISPENNPAGTRKKKKKKQAKPKTSQNEPAQEKTLVEQTVATDTTRQPKRSTANLKLETGDHICLVGNELGERMQHHNWFETGLHAAFPNKKLTVRNLCFPGDEPQLRIRSKNFGSPDSHLTHSKANVVLFFFGFNESFAGQQGLAKFTQEMKKVIVGTQQQDYNGDGKPPQIVLVSPIAFEGGKSNPNLPTGEQENLNLEMYTNALRELAVQHDVGFVDLFEPTKRLFSRTDKALTLNGAHLNDDGYKALAPILLNELFRKTIASVDEALKAEVADKNFHWWHRYRTVNGFSVYGDRSRAGRDGSGKFNNFDVMQRELEILDQMTANRDQRIWLVADGNLIPKEVFDDNTLPFLKPTTNVGTPDDRNRKAGKLGSLDYLTAEDQVKLFELAPGFEIELFASEEQFPELANPVSMNFDSKGRLWVSTMQSYPQWKPKTKLDDKLLIFEDDDSDGKADRCKVFAGGLHQPTGFELGNNGVYVAEQPDVLFLQDLDGDDKADTRIRKLVGFDSADSHHGIAAFFWGPGGNLYFQEGTFKHSQVESTYGLNRLSEAGIWKYDPRTEKMSVHASFAFSNPWGHIFDRWGQDFIGDASNGNSFWGTPISGHLPYPLKHPGGAQEKRFRKVVGRNANGYKSLYKKRIRPLAGCEIVSSRHFPDDMQGNWLVTNVIGERAVLNHKINDQGAGFWGTEKPAIVSCKDGNFRPVDVEFGPDGSLYIIDWHNALIGHLQHNLRDPSRDQSHGRIWRVTCKNRPLVKPPKIDGASVAELLETLKVYEDRNRYRAKRELAQRKVDDVLPKVKKWLAGLDQNDAEYEHHLLEGLWLYQTFNTVEKDLLKKVLAAKNFRARAAATRVLSHWLDRVEDPILWLKPMVNDDHPRVRLEAVRALSFLKGDDAIGLALEVLEHPTDYYIEYTLEETMRALEN